MRYNGAGRALELDTTKTGVIWNLKTLTWDSALPLPNGVATEYSEFVCNSKLAVFSTYSPYTLTAMVF